MIAWLPLPSVACTRCGDGGLYITEEPGYEDYPPHGGFASVNIIEHYCECPAGLVAELNGMTPPADSF